MLVLDSITGLVCVFETFKNGAEDGRSILSYSKKSLENTNNKLNTLHTLYKYPNKYSQTILGAIITKIVTYLQLYLQILVFTQIKCANKRKN